MPRVRFLQDFQGKETNEIFYKLGQEVELPDHITSRLVADKRAEYVSAGDPPAVVLENVTNVETVVVEEAADEPAEEVDFVEVLREDFESPDPEPKPKRGKRGKK